MTFPFPQSISTVRARRSFFLGVVCYAPVAPVGVECSPLQRNQISPVLAPCKCSIVKERDFVCDDVNDG